jgi:hypothetical protein
VEWIQLAQDRCRWRALVNTVMNLRVLAQEFSYLMNGSCENAKKVLVPYKARENC